MSRIVTAVLAILVLAPLRALAVPEPIALLHARIDALAAHAPGQVAVDIEDLTTGYRVGVRAATPMPAASTIKVPIMVEVFRQLEAGRFDFHTIVRVRNTDRDYGYGDLAHAPTGAPYTVSQLLRDMIDVSDNTAANMLLRLVGRTNVNATMLSLGLEHTVITGPIRTNHWSVRTALRSTPADMVRLLAMMARGKLVDPWASHEMIAILERDEFDSLLPEPLPSGTLIAHKTGSFHDTLNDVGIVYEPNAPYAIAVMTTGLDDRQLGRVWIRDLSRATYHSEELLAQWRLQSGITEFRGEVPLDSPDITRWTSGAGR
ncbi:MAG: serine hydrolase [Vulcanimicrobiaceae bacterium]